ncbi:DUF3048 domain-containing protein [Halobacillus kuroshimensis]|uniref:DUF3048 domain-containing protein n=1 Tax=Halobacillus kuroshimensis TaxID=302481 RepID=A0ABS3DWQ7_9BACI|nr:DUF3048 domain-containing protein [Halobacillus kuroshimensis]MBN8235758.1 DUF3048 domain-containing protein [Halobacillus kuroshimensis]
MKKLLLIGLLTAGLTACQSTGGTPGEKAAETPDPVPAGDVFPLTGEPGAGDKSGRVLGVMVNNHPKARPQSGLSQADLVYEALAEGQITRFLALFHSDIPDTIGPVRSARPYYFELAYGYDALYAYHGASHSIYQQLAGTSMDAVDGAVYDNNGWLFRRSGDRSAPHNSYLWTEGLDRVVVEKGLTEGDPPEALYFTDESPDGRPAEEVQVTYGSRTQVRWQYSDQGFLRFNDGEPSVDRSTMEQISADNVWIIEARHQIIDEAGRREVDLTSGGRGFLFQKGTMKEVEWRNTDGRLLPYEGEEQVPFVPGNTWINIIPESAAVQF